VRARVLISAVVRESEKKVREKERVREREERKKVQDLRFMVQV